MTDVFNEMNKPEQPIEPVKDKVPFMACLVHEATKAYEQYIVWVCLAIDVFTATLLLVIADQTIHPAYVVMVQRSYEISIWIISSVATATIGTATAIPLWLYVTAAIVLPPAIYALCICIDRRLTDKQKAIAVLSIGISIVLFTCVALCFMTVMVGGMSG